MQMRTTQPPATERQRNDRALVRNHTTIPTARGRPMVSGRVINRMAHRIRSGQAAVPGIHTGSPARDTQIN